MRKIDHLWPFGLAAALLVLAAGPALAQSNAEPMSTAVRTPPPVAAAPPGPLGVDRTPDADEDGPPVRDGKIHGMVEAGVGTNGYRHGAVAVDAPLPGGGDVAIAVQSDQIQAGKGRRLAN